MKEFISILISYILMGIADNIDNFFNNAISIDTVIVCGSLFSIDLILKSISEIGIYTYRTVRKNEWQYLNINFIVSLILGIVVFFTRKHIVQIFNITEAQKILLSNILSIYMIYLVCGRFLNALLEMIRLKGELKLYNKSLLLYYITLIILDFLAFITTKKLILLFVATMITWIISIMYMLKKLKLKFELPNKETLLNVKKIWNSNNIRKITVKSLYFNIWSNCELSGH